MVNVPDFFADVFDDALYLCFELHDELVQFDDGTQRSEEPAAKYPRSDVTTILTMLFSLSKSMRKFCAGVPREIVPAHSRSLSSSMVGSFCLLSW